MPLTLKLQQKKLNCTQDFQSKVFVIVSNDKAYQSYAVVASYLTPPHQKL